MAEVQTMAKRKTSGTIAGDLLGGLSSVLVALPSAMAYGLVIYGPLGAGYAGMAVISGLIGTIVIGAVAAATGGTPGLISAPCAPAAAVLSVFAMELMAGGAVAPAAAPLILALAGLGAGILQSVIGMAGGGRLIKYIPYPVVAGYLSGVGLTIVIGQIPKLFGYPKGTSLLAGLTSPSAWQMPGVIVGAVTIAAMLLVPRLKLAIPAPILALVAGIAVYGGLAAVIPGLRTLDHNKLVIGAINASPGELGTYLLDHWRSIGGLKLASLPLVLMPAVTLAVLLSIDTLKTCVILDAMTGNRHDSNRELRAQGMANILSAGFGGLPGAGTMGATLVNLNSGGSGRASGLFESGFAVAILLLLARFMAWIPVSALAGILIVVGLRMIDVKTIQLIRNKATRLDVAVILAVIVSALSFSLLTASGVGIAMAIVLFLREQVRTSVIRHRLTGATAFSKKRRTEAERTTLEQTGPETVVCQLQGQLFFGTADQLYSTLEPDLATARCIILDMKRVRGIDYSAVNTLKQIRRKLEGHHGTLALASVSGGNGENSSLRNYLVSLGLEAAEPSGTAETPVSHGLAYFDTMEAALEWDEDRRLSEKGVTRDTRAFELQSFGLFADLSPGSIDALRQAVELKVFQDGQTVFRQGDAGDSLLFIRSGAVTVSLPLAGGGRHDLAVFQRGDIFGEMAFLDRENRSADALANGTTEIYVLTRQRFDTLASTNPEIGTLLLSSLARELSQRLRLNNVELKALEE